MLVIMHSTDDEMSRSLMQINKAIIASDVPRLQDLQAPRILHLRSLPYNGKCLKRYRLARCGVKAMGVTSLIMIVIVDVT